MLRLVKSRRDVMVSLRSKESRFNKLFMKALAIALFFHLSAVVLFKVRHFITKDDVVFPPSSVEIDLAFDAGENSVIAQIEKEKYRQNELLEPPQTNPRIPVLTFAPLTRHLEYIKEKGLSAHPFLRIEEDWDYLDAFHEQKNLLQPITISISGILAEVPLLNDESIANGKVKGSFGVERVVYTVQVENKTGTIFWHVVQVGAQSEEAQEMANAILQKMRFRPNTEGFVTSGEVEIVLTQGDA